MVKNYISTAILLIGLLFSLNNSYSQAVNFTGNPGDFLPSQKITGGDNVDYYVSFSATTLYFGAFRTNGDTFAADHYFTIYFDTDPEPSLTTFIPGKSSGSTTGYSQHGRTPTLPFTANERFAITNNPAPPPTNEYVSRQHRHGSGTWTVVQPTTSVKRHVSSTALELAIDISRLKTTSLDPKGIYFSMFMASNDGFYGYSDGDYPINFIGNNSSGYFGGIGLTSGVANPTDHFNIPITHNLPLYDHPTDGGKYAYMEFPGGDMYFTLTGNVELVEGGTTIIRQNGALRVNGTFTNNGLITFESISNAYSGLIATTVDGNGRAEYQMYVNKAGTGTTGGNDLISAPLTGQRFEDFAATNNNILVFNTNRPTQKGFGPFNKTTRTYQNYDTEIDADTPLTAGVGYRTGANIDGSLTGGTFIFTGEINTGDINVPIENSPNSEMWNLIGNPYPSYIDTPALIALNQEVFETNFGTIFAYNGNINNSPVNFDRWIPINYIQRSNIAPGQGFYIATKSTADVFKFTPDMRKEAFGDDFIEYRAAAPVENVGLRLTITNSSTIRHTEIYFHTNGTLDNDFGYDSGQYGNPAFTIFSKLIEDADNLNIPLSIQTLPYSSLDTEFIVPIGIKAPQGEQLTISAIDTAPTPFPLPEAVDVYFEDKVANTSTLLDTSPVPHGHHYIFTPSTNLKGEMDRFSLRFVNTTLSIDNPDFDAINVYSPLNTGNIIVRGTVSEVTSLEVFDLNGRLLQTFSVQPNQSINRFEVSNLATGIYIVKLNNKTQSKIKKIQLSNKL